jgi:integrase
MGRRVMARPPKYVHGFIDRHGKPRWYFRRKGFAKVPLPGLPWSPEFMAAYEAANSGRVPIAGKAPIDPAVRDSIRELALSYYASLTFKTLKTRSQQTYRGFIDRFVAQHGDKSALKIEPQHISQLMEKRAPGAANWLLKVLRLLFKHAVAIRMRPDDPTRDIRFIKIKTSGFHAWTEQEIARFEAHHAIGTRARLALALLLYTGQRRSDVVLMGRQHIKDGVLYVKQTKTGAEVWVPVMPDLAAAIADVPTMTFLTTQFGGPYTPDAFGHWFRWQCDAAGLPAECSAHGLRKAAARRLADAGCSAHEIAAITGHATLREVERYTRGADRKRLAQSASEKLNREQKLANLNDRVANSDKNPSKNNGRSS